MWLTPGSGIRFGKLRAISSACRASGLEESCLLTDNLNDTNWIPPPVHQSTVTDNAVPDNAAIIVEGLLKVIADGTNSRRTWSEAMASYVAVMLQQAGERSPAEMRLFHRKLIFLVESYQDGRDWKFEASLVTQHPGYGLARIDTFKRNEPSITVFPSSSTIFFSNTIATRSSRTFV
uniref:Uncharacterized protein n=1 Tax=Anopheles albimanus TaxID=7167 RepID=A0A182F407_ANOAL